MLDKTLTIDIMIDNLMKYLPLAYITLTTIGLLKQTIYYRIFNINIIEFMQITEVLALLTNDIILYTIILFLCFAILALLSKTDSFEESDLIEVYNMPFWRRHIAFPNKLSWAMLIVTLGGSVGLILSGEYMKLTSIMAFTFAGFCAFIYLVITSEICRAIFVKTNNPRTNIAITIQMMSTFIFILVTVVVKNGLDIRFKENSSDIELYTDQNSNSINKNHIFIGKTDKYIFMFDYKNRKTEIYFTDFVKKIVVLR